MNKPQLRFEGFDDEWEEKQIKDFISDFTVKNDKTRNYPILTSSRHGIESQEEHFGNAQQHDTTDYNVIPNGYCTYRNRSDDYSFVFNVNKLGYTGIVSKFYPVFTFIKDDAYFITENLNSNQKLIRNIAMLAIGTGQKVLSYNDFKELQLKKPSLQEQQKIGVFLSKIDSLIQAKTQKLESLKSVKKSLLQKCFPKDGEKVPEMRFEGFSGEWKEAVIGDVSEIITGGTPSTEKIEYWDNKEIPWLSSGEVNKKRITFTDDFISKNGYENSSATWIPENSVLIALAGQGKTRGTVAINKIPLTTNQSIAGIVLNKNMDAEFIFQNLERKYIQIRKMSSGDGSRGGLNKQLVSEINFMYPPTLDEQIKIGKLLEKYDSLIALQQQEIDKLKTIKKALLQKMFV